MANMTLVRQASPQGRRIKSRGRTNLRHLNSRESENGLHAHFGDAEQVKSYRLWRVDTFLFDEAFGNILQVIFGMRKKVLPRDLALRPCWQTDSLCNVPGTSGKSLLHMVTATTVAVRTRSLELTTLVENSNAHSHKYPEPPTIAPL